jgi:hypothetical protein
MRESYRIGSKRIQYLKYLLDFNVALHFQLLEHDEQLIVVDDSVIIRIHILKEFARTLDLVTVLPQRVLEG